MDASPEKLISLSSSAGMMGTTRTLIRVIERNLPVHTLPMSDTQCPWTPMDSRSKPCLRPGTSLSLS
jgi:hypothetical protein